jgi:hypothetical protein
MPESAFADLVARIRTGDQEAAVRMAGRAYRSHRCVSDQSAQDLVSTHNRSHRREQGLGTRPARRHEPIRWPLCLHYNWRKNQGGDSPWTE